MRNPPNDHIWNLWNDGGPFIGDEGATHGRVTVEIGWGLHKSASATIGNYHKGPIRWFQLADNSQTETEIPNVATIEIDRTIDVDAASCTITLFNQRMADNSEPSPSGTATASLGQPGFYWPGRGESAESLERWGWEQNAWNDVLQPNALIRTYQGYGGKDKTIANAVADGNLLLTGVWLVDQITQDAKTGAFTISCRDVAKLLIEQQIYPPLVPRRKSQGVNVSNPKLANYPLNYFRWIFRHQDVVPYGNTVYHTGFVAHEEQFALNNTDASTHYEDDSGNLYGGNQAIDGNDIDTYWLSEGRVNQGVEYVTFHMLTPLDIGGVNIIPYGGNYTCYVSVYRNGAWEEHPETPGVQTPPNGSINYVAKQGIGWERPITIDLHGPGEHGTWVNVERVRITFQHLAKLGPNPPLRAGVRDFQVGVFSKTVSGEGKVICGIGRGSNDPDDTRGYWIVGTDGGVYNFGGLKFYGSRAGKHLNERISGMATNPVTGKGYRLCSEDGGVFCFGDVYYHGSLPGRGITLAEGIKVEQIENGDAGKTGYYLLRNSGGVDAFGTATDHGNGTLLGGDPTDLYYFSAMGVKQSVPRGYWLMTTAHEIEAIGGADPVPFMEGGGSEIAFDGTGWNVGFDGLATALEVHPNGEGFWTCTAFGRVRAYGWKDAAHTQPMETFGGLPSIGVNIVPGQQKGITDMVRTPSGEGYWLVGQDGGVYAFGDAQFSGSLPEQYNAIGDGNYEDYTDIVKDLLLWSGWWFRPTANPLDSDPEVFGNLEGTGIYSPDNLTEDFFDKKPVIDVINSLKEIVGYINYADEIGAYHFKSPNIWSIGNFLETGEPTSRTAVIDEERQIINYQVTVNDRDARSRIIIATEDPALNLAGTKSYTLVSQWAAEVLRGIERPALWVNGKFLNKAIQKRMAQLIDMHIFMQARQGQVTIPANPVIQIDDQVQIYERSTSDTYRHYVRGYTSRMDLQSGEYTMNLQTHWMGDGDSWFLDYNPVDLAVNDPTDDEPEAPAFFAESPPDGETATFYQYTFQATGNPPPIFTVTSGSLPPGLVLMQGGVLSGTPTTAGTYNFTVTTTNGVGAGDTTAVTLVVSVGSTSNAPSFQNANPPNGTVGSSYTYTFTATGIPSPTFSILSGSVPAGTSLNSTTGVLSGTPTTATTYNFTVRATNASGTDDAAVDVIVSSSGGSSSPPPSGGYFSVLGVGASLPGGMSAAGADAAAAAAVNYSTWEPRPGNNTANHNTLSQPPTIDVDTADFDSTWNSTYLPRVSGNFEGTTDEIIQWAAYKWGWSDEYVRAQLIQESNWTQSAMGDYEPASNGHRVHDRSDDPSPTSFSICQIRWYYHPPIVALGGVTTGSNDPGSSYPKSVQSTAWALDYFLCYLRGVYDGHSTYLNGGGMAGSGNAWAAIGSWFSGDWLDSSANGYIADVQDHLANKPWLDGGF